MEEILNFTKNSPNRLRESFFIKNNVELYNKIFFFTKELDISFKQKVWHYVFNKPHYITCYCGNSLKFKNNWKEGYNKYCSTKCASNSVEFKEEVKNTLLEKYGVTHYSKTKEYVIKSKSTYLKKYGVDNYTKTEEYNKKSKKTCLEKYGVDSYIKTEELKKKVKESYIFKNDKYRVDNFNIAKNKFYIKYLGEQINLFKCDSGKDHTFEISTDNYYGRVKNNNSICTICTPISSRTSIKESELYEFIKDNYSGQIILNYKDKFEIDIYLPELKIGFEFNGIWWHSSKYKENNYHINKTNFFKERNIRIIHIWEDDWIYKIDIIKYQILSFLGKIDNRIWARKCTISEVDTKTTKDFLNKNHIQGFVKSNTKIGLYYNNELVSIMTFDKFEGRKKMSDNEWNLSRFCTKNELSVIGAASKLLNYFTKKYNPKRIISYADKDWSNGNMYLKIGFNKISETKPDYKYIINNTRKHKSNFRKSRLNTNLTESSYMKTKQIYKIYDCGKIKFEILM